MRRFLLVILVALVAGLWWWRDDAARLAAERLPFAAPYLAPAKMAATPGARPEPPPVPVVLARAEVKPLPVVIEAIGTVQPLASIALKPRIDSQITAVGVKEGAKVKEGDLLVSLDSRALKAQLAQADATLAKDNAQLEQQKRDLARAEDLLAKRITSEVQRDTAGTAVRVQLAQIAADAAQRDNLAALLSYTEIRAPVSGRIGSIALKVGATVKAGDLAIATLNQIDPIYISFAVPQSRFAALRKAMAAGPVKVEALPGQGTVSGTVSGTISFVENTVDLATGTVLAKALMDNRDEQLWPGGFVSVKAVLGVQEEAVAVPSAAVQIGQQGAYLFVADAAGGRARLVTVSVDRTVGDVSVIGAGLKGGEDVVVDGQLRLVDGAAIRASRARPAAGGGVARGAGEPENAPAAPRRG